MKMPDAISAALLAPCGINCLVCYVHLKPKKPCQGCRGADASKPEHCRKCKIKDCAITHQVEFCGECAAFPCTRLKRLDQSYQKRYRVSLIDNLRRLQTTSAAAFHLTEKEKWTCSRCGGVISLHDGICSDCGQIYA